MKRPLLIRKVIVPPGKRAGNTNPDKGNQLDEGTWLFFDLYLLGFHERYYYLVFLGVSETSPMLDTKVTSALMNGVVQVAAHHLLDAELLAQSLAPVGLGQLAHFQAILHSS